MSDKEANRKSCQLFPLVTMRGGGGGGGAKNGDVRIHLKCKIPGFTSRC